MKTNLFFALGLGLFTSLGVSAQYTVSNLTLPVQHADVSVVDYDTDGDLDIIISGENGGIRMLQVFENNGTGTFTTTPSPFTPVTRTTFDWDDINRDGNLDMIMSGFPQTGPPFDSVYTSDGAGNFTKATNIAIAQQAPGSGFADLNNDGYADIYVFGNKFEGHAQIFFNDKMGGFTQSSQFDAFNFVDPEVSEIDFDNDKDIDLFVTAGFEDAVASRFSKMFINDGSGIFAVQDLGLVPKGNGSAVWGDYNKDGYPDLLLNGDGFLGSGEDNDGIYRLYTNNAGTFTANRTFEFYRQNSTGDGGRFLDWDNDGDLDLVVTGFNGTRQATDIYLNDGAGVFTADPNNASIPGVSESSIEAADIDNDSDLDLIVTGFSNHDYNGGGSAFNANVSYFITNPATAPNLGPTSPTNLQVTGTQAALSFSWDSATDATTSRASLTYNMFLINLDSNQTFIYSNADTGTGKLKLQRMGNVQHNTGWVLHDLPPGNYRWGVQTIDNSFMGSPFTAVNFTVNADGTLPVTIADYSVKPERNKAKIEWSTAIEQNNDRFEVYRSGDGKNFTKLESVKAKGSGANQYFVYDNNPSSGVNYYRLLQYDADGKMKDLGIKTVSFNTVNNATAITFPNPSYSEIGVRLSNFKGKEINVRMSDMSGRMIHSETIAVNNSQGYYMLRLKNKPLSGQYILNVSGENLKESLKVLVK